MVAIRPCPLQHTGTPAYSYGPEDKLVNIHYLVCVHCVPVFHTHYQARATYTRNRLKIYYLHTTPIKFYQNAAIHVIISVKLAR